jgi:hypothetical protein
MDESNIAKKVNAVATPLALSGAGIYGFYLVLSKILETQSFSSIGERDTATFINKALDYMFLLSSACLVLGVAAYISSKLIMSRARKKAPKLEIIDASLESSISEITKGK